MGKDAEGWAYYSTSELLHAGNEGDEGGPQGKGASEAFGPGDVVGVELDLHEGTLRFLKNDRCGGFIILLLFVCLIGGGGGSRGCRDVACLGRRSVVKMESHVLHLFNCFVASTATNTTNSDIGLHFSGLRAHPARLGGEGTGFEVQLITLVVPFFLKIKS